MTDCQYQCGYIIGEWCVVISSVCNCCASSCINFCNGIFNGVITEEIELSNQ